jgi:hypothetical protein
MRAEVILFSLFMVVSSQACADDTQLRRFPISGVGTLVVPLPERWTDTGDKAGSRIYRTPSGETLMLTILRNADGRSDFAAPARIRQALEAEGRPHVPGSVEQALEFVEIVGASNTGYYFSLTDRNLVGKEPGPTEYRVMTQGMLGVGELLLYFTVLSQQKDTTIVREALAAMRGATLQPSR